MRYLGYTLADESAQPTEPPPPELFEKMGKFVEEATKAGHQAAIAACHAGAFPAEATDWAEVVSLYAALAVVMPSPIVELNRAVAVSMAWGPAAALPLVEELVQRGRAPAPRGACRPLPRSCRCAGAAGRSMSLVHSMPAGAGHGRTAGG